MSSMMMGFPPTPPTPPIYDLTILAHPIAELTVQFDSIIRGGKPPYTYKWDFGDGNQSLEAKPLHIYIVRVGLIQLS